MIRAAASDEQGALEAEVHLVVRRIAAVFAVVIGIMLLGFTLGEHLVSRSRDAQRIADHYQPYLASVAAVAASTSTE